MSRYDKERDRRRILVVVAVIALFFAGFFMWGRTVNNGLDDTDREVRW